MTAPGFISPGESLQRSQTIYRKFADQHGRRFAAQCDIRNGEPKEELRPVNDEQRQFNPPWLPPMQYAKMRRGSEQFSWDYTTLAQELAGMTAEKYSSYRKFAMREKLPIPEVGGVVDALILDVLGKPPLSPAIPLACEQGDPWVLGFPNAPVNPYLKEILEQGVGSSSKEALDYIRERLAETAAAAKVPLVEARVEAPAVTTKAKRIDDLPELAEMPEITYQQFVAECRGRKMDLVTIGKLWQQHKDNIAANSAAGTVAA